MGLETSIIVSFDNLQNRQVKVQMSDIDFLWSEKRTNIWDEVIEMIAASSFSSRHAPVLMSLYGLNADSADGSLYGRPFCQIEVG